MPVSQVSSHHLLIASVMVEVSVKGDRQSYILGVRRRWQWLENEQSAVAQGTVTCSPEELSTIAEGSGDDGMQKE